MTEVRPTYPRRAASDIAAIMAAVAIVCVGIIVATARGWIGLSWADAWSLVAWVVVVATIVAGFISWREATL